MAVLDIDIGNTRLKWRCGELRGVLARQRDWQGSDLRLNAPPERVRVANVAGAAVAGKVRQWALGRWGLEPEFAAASEEAAGVRCGYPEPQQMGVDRWLAVLAGYHKFRHEMTSGLVIVSAGSAVTVDLLRATGEHLGGYIVPGLEMQRRALFAGTSAVKVSGHWQGESLAPGEDTGQAVIHGCLGMVVALIDAARREFGEQVTVLMSGGDAGYLLPHLAAPAALEPELVLDGLAVLMP